MNNHEIWATCTICGDEYDIRLGGCGCGLKIKEKQKVK